MTPLQLVHTLQLSDSLFPVGAFAYSDGLETATSSGKVKDSASLETWLEHFLQSVFVSCEGKALLQCMRAVRHENWSAILTIDEELTALKPSATTRASSKSVGRRLIAAYGSIVDDVEFRAKVDMLVECNVPVAYALVFSHRGIEETEALVAYGYTRLAGIVSAAMRLMSLGHQQGQSLLTNAAGRLPAAAQQIIREEAEPLYSFNPLLDVEQMNHRYVYSRLFRS